MWFFALYWGGHLSHLYKLIQRWFWGEWYRIRTLKRHLGYRMILYNVCPRSSDPFYRVSYYTKWVITSCTDSRRYYIRMGIFCFSPTIKQRAAMVSFRLIYWVPQKLPQIYTVIAYICIGKVAWFAVYICGNIWNALYIFHSPAPLPTPLIRRYIDG